MAKTSTLYKKKGLNLPEEDRYHIEALPGPDPFIGLSTVPGLNEENFKGFIGRDQVAMVMFYNPEELASTYSRFQFRLAVKFTKTPDRMFAAVDCTQQEGLCANEAIAKLPTFRIYSRGNTINTFVGGPNPINPYELKSLLENAPAGGDRRQGGACARN